MHKKHLSKMHASLRKHDALQVGVYDAASEMHDAMWGGIDHLKGYFSKDAHSAMGLLGALTKAVQAHAATVAAHRKAHAAFTATASAALQSLADKAGVDLGEFYGREEAGPHAGGHSSGGAPADEGTAYPGERSAGFREEADKVVKALSGGRIQVDAQGQERIVATSGRAPGFRKIDSEGTTKSVATEGVTSQDIEELKKAIPLDVQPAPRTLPVSDAHREELRKSGYRPVEDLNTQNLRPNERRALLDKLGDHARGTKVRKVL